MLQEIVYNLRPPKVNININILQKYCKECVINCRAIPDYTNINNKKYSNILTKYKNFICDKNYFCFHQKPLNIHKYCFNGNFTEI